MATTYNPAGGGRIVLVFNEPVSTASTDTPADDLTSTTMTVPELVYGSDDGDNVLHLVPVTTWDAAGFDPGATEILAMLPGALADTQGNPNLDVTPITVGDGPVITGVSISNRRDDFNNGQSDPTLPPIATGPNNNVVSVSFDAPVQFVTTDDAAFGATIEFNGQPLTSAGSGTPTITISRDPGATGNFLYMQPGVMNLRLAASTIRWSADAVSNGALDFRTTDNDGPLLNAVYMNVKTSAPDDDVLAVVFDQPVAGSLPTSPIASVLTPGGWSIDDGTIYSWFSTNWTNVLRGFGFTWSTALGKQTAYTVRLTDPALLTDHQQRPSLQANPADILVHFGLGIVRAAYDNNLTPANYEDDQLYIYLSEPVENAVDISPAHFTLEGFAWGDNPIVTHTPAPIPDNFSVVVIRNFARAANPNPWEPGDRLIPTDPRLPDPDIPNLIGAVSGEPLHDTPVAGTVSDVRWAPVLDESRPCQLDMTDTHSMPEDAWTYDVSRDYYTLFLRFSETVANGGVAGTEDADQYFLFPVRVQDEPLWDKTRMATFLGSAIPIGDVHAHQIDSVTRLAVPISVTDWNPSAPPNALFQTVDGYDITSPSMLTFILASADWQGNVARIETVNPNEYGWTWLRTQSQGACCALDGSCTLSSEEECVGPNVWQGGGCQPNPCLPYGACCQPDGACALTRDVDCSVPGIWQGLGVPCDPNPCLMGACCLRSQPGICEIHTLVQCDSYNGFYLGNGTLCAPSDTCLTTGVNGTSPGVPRLQVLPAPNPSARGAVIRCLLPLRSLTTVVIFDATGRTVRRLHEGDLQAGETLLSWDGRDDAGRDLPSGTYWTRITTPDCTKTARAVVAR